jgi:hypothetical protein
MIRAKRRRVVMSKAIPAAFGSAPARLIWTGPAMAGAVAARRTRRAVWRMNGHPTAVAPRARLCQGVAIRCGNGQVTDE